jgi:hypothetical protein
MKGRESCPDMWCLRGRWCGLGLEVQVGGMVRCVEGALVVGWLPGCLAGWLVDLLQFFSTPKTAESKAHDCCNAVQYRAVQSCTAGHHSNAALPLL